MNRFERWWYNEGSGLRPLPGEDAETHAHRVSRIAWDNGFYCAKHPCDGNHGGNACKDPECWQR